VVTVVGISGEILVDLRLVCLDFLVIHMKRLSAISPKMINRLRGSDLGSLQNLCFKEKNHHFRVVSSPLCSI